jgi:hypothetical protein
VGQHHGQTPGLEGPHHLLQFKIAFQLFPDKKQQRRQGLIRRRCAPSTKNTAKAGGSFGGG